MMNDIEFIGSTVEKTARHYDISVTQFKREDDEADKLLEKLYDHAQLVKGATSRASKAKLGEEISRIECLYAYYWKRYDRNFMTKLNEVRKIRDGIKLPKNNWCYMGDNY